MGLALRRLGHILGAAVVSARELFGHESAGDPFNGLYITPAHAERALEIAAIDPVAGVDSADIRPDWTEICRHDPHWHWLRTTYGLSEFELDVVLLALAPELDLRYEKVFGYLQDDVGQRLPTVALALELLTADARQKTSCRAVFAADAPLVRHRVLALTSNPRNPSASVLARYLQIDAQIVDALLGITALDPRLRVSCELSRPQPGCLDEALRAEVADSLLHMAADAWAHHPLTLYFRGAPGTGRRAAAQWIAGRLGVPLLTVHAGLLAHDHTVDDELAVVFRAASLHGALLFIDEFEMFGDHDHDRGAVSAMFERRLAAHTGVTIVAGTRDWVPRGRDVLGIVVVPFLVPEVGSRRAVWAAELLDHRIDASPRDIDALASRFRFTAGQIRDAVRTAAHWQGVAGADVTLTVGQLFASARGQCGSALAALARKVEPIYGWDDIVLPADVTAQLHELCLRVTHGDRVMGEWGFDRMMSQGKGITALFSGPPGTGKTMAAEVIANDLGIDLYRVDLSSVVSKYIGETEKNLDAIFTAALQANACLLFDEADAIFGKRSEVRDSHDRYANLEISYLLQRMEQYDGLAVLTTNRRHYLDDAFMRRLHFVIDFPLPSEDDRLRIWQIRIPPEAPRDPLVDLVFLAKAYPLPGGNISSATLRAAFLAAAADSPITMTHLLSAVEQEYRKVGKVVPAPGADLPENQR